MKTGEVLTGAATHRKVSQLSNTVSPVRGGPSEGRARKMAWAGRPAAAFVALACGLVGLLGGESARAEAGPACPRGERNALSEIGCELGRDLGLEEGALLAAAPVQSDVKLDKTAALGERIVRVVGGALAAGVQVHPAPVTLAEARGLAQRRGRLVYLTPELVSGKLRITADVYVGAHAFWDRVKAPSNAPVKHAFAERPADGEVRSFLPPPPLLVSARDSAPLLDRSVLAVACDDADGDGGPELLLVGRRRIVLGRITQGQLAPRVERAWSDLSAVAASPLRAPLSAARIQDGFVDVGSSDRAELVRLDPALALKAKSERALPWPTAGCSSLDAAGANGTPTSCFNRATPWPAALAGNVDAFAAAVAVSDSGETRRVVAVRPVGKRSAELTDDRGRRAEVADVGAQLALGDLDGDGQMEIISSRPTFDPAKDTLRVDTWLADGQVTKRVELPLSEVRAVAVCPWPGQGLAPIVAAAADRVWVLR